MVFRNTATINFKKMRNELGFYKILDFKTRNSLKIPRQEKIALPRHFQGQDKKQEIFNFFKN